MIGRPYMGGGGGAGQALYNLQGVVDVALRS